MLILPSLVAIMMHPLAAMMSLQSKTVKMRVFKLDSYLNSA